MVSSKALLQLFLPSLATASRDTSYNMSFTLGSGDSTPPILTGISCPLNYTPGHDLQVNFTAIDTGLGIGSHFLKYSFDNGTTWHSATYQQPNYLIHCEEADSLAVLINVTDKAGNSLQYLTTPISLCSKVKLDGSLGDYGKSISGNLTSTERHGLSGVAVSLSRAWQTAYTIVDENGEFTFSLPHPDMPPLYIVASASVGFYSSEEVTVTSAVAVTNVVAVVPHCSSKVGNDLWVFQGRPVYVNVTVLNKGDFDENVTVTLYYNSTPGNSAKGINSPNILLSAGQTQTIVLLWNTTDMPYCLNYTITAVATIPLDINSADNGLSCGPINVRIMGDINGDGKVDGKDIVAVAMSFASCGPDFSCKDSPPSATWNLDCDINCDNKIDGKDLVLVALSFGK